MDKQSKFDYEELKKKTIEQLRSGKSLFGKDGAFVNKPYITVNQTSLFYGRDF